MFLMKVAQRLSTSSILEQGTGIVNLTQSIFLINQTLDNNATIFPNSIKIPDKQYYVPFSDIKMLK